MERLELYLVALNDVAYINSENTVFSIRELYNDDLSSIIEYAWNDAAEAKEVAEELNGTVKEFVLVDLE